jgi:tRNA pseudouridine55 synthase
MVHLQHMKSPWIETDIVLVAKPIDWTSFDVVKKVRNCLAIKKVGHAGTLDPLATGLMIVGVGTGTKKLENYIKLPKTYRAEICLGKSTTTGDAEGEIINQQDTVEMADDQITQAVTRLVGDLELPVPAYSAVKVNGRRLYKSARQGQAVETPVRTMTVIEAEAISLRADDIYRYVLVELRVASGVYIRSVAEYLGEILGVPASLASLERTSIGNWNLSQATTIESLCHNK